MPQQAETTSPPGIQVRGRSFMALALTPEPPLAIWFSALDDHLRDARGLFTDRAVIVDLTLAAAEGREAVLIMLDGLEGRGLRVIGLEGARPGLLDGTHWARMPTQLHGREFEARASPVAKQAPTSLVIEGPVRSGQSVFFETGDVTVIGAVASGAEVIAGGSIHIYGALRGRAIAGLRPNSDARIFCSRMEAEMVGVDRLYRTAEHWGPALHGRGVQVRSDRGALRLTALD